MATLQVGELAPNFSLYNTEKNKISLSNCKGQNVILHFFPLAFTGVCTQQMCTNRDNMNEYQKLNAKVFGISVDSLFVLEKFKAENNLQFDLLSDFNKDVSIAYDVLFDVFPAFEMKGVSKRAAFVIDKNGVLVHAEILPTPGVLPNFAAIEEALKKMA